MSLPDTHALIPLEHLVELESSAYFNSPSIATRAAGTAQTTLIFAALAGAVAGGSWGVAKAMDWLEERNFQREQRKAQAQNVRLS